MTGRPNLALAFLCPSLLGKVNGFDVYTLVHEFTHALGFVDFLWSQVREWTDIDHDDGPRYENSMVELLHSWWHSSASFKQPHS